MKRTKDVDWNEISVRKVWFVCPVAFNHGFICRNCIKLKNKVQKQIIFASSIKAAKLRIGHTFSYEESRIVIYNYASYGNGNRNKG